MTIEDLITSAESSIQSGYLIAGLDFFLQARDLAYKLGDVTSYIQCCQSAAVVYDRLGKVEEAVSSLDLGISAATMDAVTFAGLHVNKGVCLLKLQRFIEARDTFLRASRELRRIPPLMRTQEMHSLIDMAETNAWGVEDILKLVASGVTVTVNDNKPGEPL